MTKSIAAWENQYGHLTNDPGLVAAWEADGLKVYSLYRDFASDHPSVAAAKYALEAAKNYVYDTGHDHNIAPLIDLIEDGLAALDHPSVQKPDKSGA